MRVKSECLVFDQHELQRLSAVGQRPEPQKRKCSFLLEQVSFYRDDTSSSTTGVTMIEFKSGTHICVAIPYEIFDALWSTWYDLKAKGAIMATPAEPKVLEELKRRLTAEQYNQFFEIETFD